MNIYTQQIAELLNVNLETAYKIQERIDEDWLLDWSECTKAQFNKVVKFVAQELQVA